MTSSFVLLGFICKLLRLFLLLLLLTTQNDIRLDGLSEV